MRALLSALFLTAGCLLSAAPQASAQTPVPTKQWDKTFGGSNHDSFDSVKRTSDGGYILGGSSSSGISGDKTQASQGLYDFWIIKLDATGTKQWDKTFGGSNQDFLRDLQQTSDGGYILGGGSYSDVGGDKTQNSRGLDDYWVVKLDATGNKQWDKTFGGNENDELFSLQQTSDGGYILGGTSNSGINGDKTQNNRGPLSTADYWVVKLDASGTKQWDKTLGGSNYDNFGQVQQTSDGGYILGGGSFSDSNGDKTQASQGLYDYWVVKLDATGNKQWDRTFGGSTQDFLGNVWQTSDGGYILGGSSASNISGDKTQNNQGPLGTADYWVVKLDASGTKQWDRTFGGNGDDFPYLQKTSDGGYILGGRSTSGLSGDKTQASRGLNDYWVVKLDAAGTKLWDKTFGGSQDDELFSLQQTSDGGYILGGRSFSGISGDKTQANQGPVNNQGVASTTDYWLIKLSADPLATASASAARPALSASPNPVRTQLTLRGPLGTPYQLLNQLGQVVRAGKLSTQPLDVQALPAGLYLLRDAASGRTAKLVKE